MLIILRKCVSNPETITQASKVIQTLIASQSTFERRRKNTKNSSSPTRQKKKVCLPKQGNENLGRSVDYLLFPLLFSIPIIDTIQCTLFICLWACTLMSQHIPEVGAIFMHKYLSSGFDLLAIKGSAYENCTRELIAQSCTEYRWLGLQILLCINELLCSDTLITPYSQCEDWISLKAHKIFT